MRTFIILILAFLTSVASTNGQTVVCETINISGYNTKQESSYLQKISISIPYGCGAILGKEIFYKNIHPNKTIKGFAIKKWKYNGYENYDVCQVYYFELQPGQQTISLGCDYISQTQPCQFNPYGLFLNQTLKSQK